MAKKKKPGGDKPNLSAKERRDIARQRIEQRRRRKQLRIWGIIGLIVLAGVGYIVVRQVQSRQSLAAYQEIASDAGCGEIQEFGGLSRDHWSRPGDTVPTYDTEPPVGGGHHSSPLPARVYPEPLGENITESGSIYQAVHSLEHGYVIVWHNDLSEDEQQAIEGALRGARKVIVVPYPKLSDDQKVALTAWGVLQYCEQADTDVIEAFVERYREATGPESHAQ